MATEQVWTLEHDGRRHRVEAGGSVNHRVRWWVDGTLRGEKRTMEDKVRVAPDGGDGGQLLVRYSAMGTPRRATLHAAGEDTGALSGLGGGLGGVDLVPEEGSAAAAYERRVLDHPHRYTALATLAGVAKVVVPILVALVAVRLAVRIPWPDVDLPSLPHPDLPSVPWPDLPSTDWPDITVPAWVGWLLDKASYVWPVVLAFVLARAEIRRRREQERKRRTETPSVSADGSGRHDA